MSKFWLLFPKPKLSKSVEHRTKDTFSKLFEGEFSCVTPISDGCAVLVENALKHLSS